jgi:hypothetical protein
VGRVGVCACSLIDNEAILFLNIFFPSRIAHIRSDGDRLDRHPWLAFFINHSPSVSRVVATGAFRLSSRRRFIPPTGRELLKRPDDTVKTILIRRAIFMLRAHNIEQASRQEKSFRSSPSPYLVDEEEKKAS